MTLSSEVVENSKYRVRVATESDIPGIISLGCEVYPGSPAWAAEQLRSHQRLFKEGQFVAEEKSTGKIVGAAASLIVYWEDYDWESPWRDFTDHGMFTNHDPTNGRTLYGAEVMVSPKIQRSGVGTLIYKARENLVRRLGLLRIRAGARLRGYHQFAKTMTPEQYVHAIVDRKIIDPTLSFQLKHGFHVLRVISGYLRFDSESLGYAAVIEWINTDVAKPEDYRHARNSKFYGED